MSHLPLNARAASRSTVKDMKAERKLALLRRVPDVIGAATTRPWCVPHMTREITGGTRSGVTSSNPDRQAGAAGVPRVRRRQAAGGVHVGTARVSDGATIGGVTISNDHQ